MLGKKQSRNPLGKLRPQPRSSRKKKAGIAVVSLGTAAAIIGVATRERGPR